MEYSSLILNAPRNGYVLKNRRGYRSHDIAQYERVKFSLNPRPNSYGNWHLREVLPEAGADGTQNDHVPNGERERVVGCGSRLWLSTDERWSVAFWEAGSGYFFTFAPYAKIGIGVGEALVLARMI